MTNITLDEVYVSPYERKRGRPKKYNTPEEALEARRKTALKYYYDNFEPVSYTHLTLPTILLV